MAGRFGPDTLTQFFGRLRDRLGFDHLSFKEPPAVHGHLRPGTRISMAQVAMRAGHDPAVAAKHYTGRVSQADRDLADAMARLLDQTEGQ